MCFLLHIVAGSEDNSGLLRRVWFCMVILSGEDLFQYAIWKCFAYVNTRHILGKTDEVLTLRACRYFRQRYPFNVKIQGTIRAPFVNTGSKEDAMA